MTTYQDADAVSAAATAKVGDVLQFNFSNSASERELTLPKGKWRLECYGAPSSYFAKHTYHTESMTTKKNESPRAGNRGGYAKGTINLVEETSIFVHTGGAGQAPDPDITYATFLAGGKNGGGSGYQAAIASTEGHARGAGGGASDVRIGTDSLYARAIVAGGGGGSFLDAYGQGIQSFGSGGRTAKTYDYTERYYDENEETEEYSHSFSLDNQFGLGKDGWNTANQSYSLAGGGGGWYGGIAGGSYRTMSFASGAYVSMWYSGAGGSSYCYTSESASEYPDGCLLDSRYYLTDTQMTEGGGPESTSANVNGYVVITCLDLGPYILSFDANGGSGAPASVSSYTSIGWTIPADTPTRDGYTFAGWSNAKP